VTQIEDASPEAAAALALEVAREGDPRTALELAQKARRKARELKLDVAEAEALNAAAVVHLIRGDAISAVAAAIDAANLARRLGVHAPLLHARVSLALAANVLGARDDVCTLLSQCVEAAMEIHDAELEVRARVALGVALGDAWSFNAAATEFARSLLVARIRPTGTSPARITTNVANLHRKRAEALAAARYEAEANRECRESISAAQRACVLAIEEGSLPTLIDALAIHGCVLATLGRPEHARALLAESVALGTSRRCRSPLPWVLCELGAIALVQDDVAAARQAYNEALAIASELTPSRKIEAACHGLADVEAKLGNGAGALQWRTRASEEAGEFDRARLQTRRQLEEFFAAAT
jgi:tetratricopeptide (TPR) repeat protein